MITFSIEFILLLGLSYFIYWALLKRTTLFNFSRFFLLISLLLSLTSPLVKFDTEMATPNELAKVAVSTVTNYSEIRGGNDVIVTSSEPRELDHFNYFNLVWVLYLLVSGIFLLRFTRNLYFLLINARFSEHRFGNLHIVLLKNKSAVFSFFNVLYMNKKEYEQGKISKSILEHEEAHSSQLHSLDILLVELVCCFFWFNPFLWLYKKAISENHEYLADKIVIDKGTNEVAYGKEIIETLINKTPPGLASGFSYLQIKNRIEMMEKTKITTKKRLLKITVVFLLFGTALSLNSFKTKATKPFVVVLDAGHGGKDPGAHNELGHSEKDISLSICQKIASLSNENEVEIILTRANDDFIALNDRAEIVNRISPDLMLSIHSEGSSSSEAAYGVRAFYNDSSLSNEYASILVTNGIGSITRVKEIKKARFVVLTEITCPGVLLSIGSINSKEEVKILEDKNEQNKIAEDIYQKLVAIKNR